MNTEVIRIQGLYPTRMFINRGNHEAKDMNRTYGFEGEAKHKHGEQTYKVHTLSSCPSQNPYKLSDSYLLTFSPPVSICEHTVQLDDHSLFSAVGNTYRSHTSSHKNKHEYNLVTRRTQEILCSAWRAIQQRWCHTG